MFNNLGPVCETHVTAAYISVQDRAALYIAQE